MIKVSCPTRVDLAGGTLDCWPLYLLIGRQRCSTVNLSISVFTHVELEKREDGRIFFESLDLNYKKEFSDLNELLSSKDSELLLVQAHLNYWKPAKGFKLRTKSDSPVGGGLGGSSSLCISLLKAFSKFENKKLSDEELVKIASNIEAQILKKPTGTQDYYPAVTPGLNEIIYSVEGACCKPLTCDKGFFDNLILLYTGRPHHSGINNWQVIKGAVEGDKKVIDALNRIADISDEVISQFKSNNFEAMPELLEKEFEARIALSEAFLSPEIYKLKELVLQNGANGIKICGAGGGGCVLVSAPAEQRQQLELLCEKNGFQVIKASPVGFTSR